MAERLVGIARLAATGASLDSKREVEYRQLPTFKLLNRCTSPDMPFDWTINPYRGCEIGCKYCYARYTHEFMERREPDAFEREIFAKQWNRADFLKDLRRIEPGSRIAIGTATDPYQPAERRYGVTRSILEVFAERSGYRVGITTKSDFVTRDIDVLRAASRGNRVSVHLTITTVDAALARKLEPRAPRPDLRLAAVKRLSEAGIDVGVFASPVLPLITDSDAQLEALFAAARDAGARFVVANPVFLMPCALRVFLPFLETEFPRLATRYRDRFTKQPYLRGDYAERLRGRIARLRERFGMASRSESRDDAPWPETAQLSLF